MDPKIKAMLIKLKIQDMILSIFYDEYMEKAVEILRYLQENIFNMDDLDLIRRYPIILQDNYVTERLINNADSSRIGYGLDKLDDHTIRLKIGIIHGTMSAYDLDNKHVQNLKTLLKPQGFTWDPEEQYFIKDFPTK